MDYRCIDTLNKDVILILSFSRDEDTMKKFVETYIENGNTIITDAVHNHGHGDFCYSLDRTSHIESVWSNP